jgi:hypothetical protein
MKTIFFTAAMVLSANLYASSFDVTGQNHDLYDGHADSTVLPTAVQPGVGDSYGDSIFYSGGYAQTTSTLHGGIDEGYANVLIDVGTPINW